jgi:hypothetical protein
VARIAGPVEAQWLTSAVWERGEAGRSDADDLRHSSLDQLQDSAHRSQTEASRTIWRASVFLYFGGS